jgi:hypothetical protein
MGGSTEAVYREPMTIRRPSVLLAPLRTRKRAAVELLALIPCVVHQTRIGRASKLAPHAPGRKHQTDSRRPGTKR